MCARDEHEEEKNPDDSQPRHRDNKTVLIISLHPHSLETRLAGIIIATVEVSLGIGIRCAAYTFASTCNDLISREKQGRRVQKFVLTQLANAPEQFLI